jgi:hypothetical protein
VPSRSFPFHYRGTSRTALLDDCWNECPRSEGSFCDYSSDRDRRKGPCPWSRIQFLSISSALVLRFEAPPAREKSASAVLCARVGDGQNFEQAHPTTLALVARDDQTKGALVCAQVLTVDRIRYHDRLASKVRVEFR